MRLLLVLLLGLLAATPVGGAAPANGFGLAGGPTQHWHRIDFPNGAQARYTTTGVHLLGDAQFVVDARWSLNPFLMLSLERVENEPGSVASNGVAGFQVRRWWSGLFVGAHAGYYVELVADASSSRTLYGPGLGFALGSEAAGTWGWVAQLDFPRVLVHGERRVGLSVLFGWRWD